MKENYLSRKQIIGIGKCGETHDVVEFFGTYWSLMDSQWVIQHLEKFSESFSVLFRRMVLGMKQTMIQQISRGAN